MFRRKQDVDRHVTSILGRIKEERERKAKGYQIARLYFEVKEYATARRYLASFLEVRETVPQAYRLLGQIEEVSGRKENAVEAYKRFLELGGPGKEVVLRVCELYSEIDVEPERGKFWLEKAEQLFPQSDVVFKLKEKLVTANQSPSDVSEMEDLISAELVKKPQDIGLRIKLLRLYLASERMEEAYHNAIETDRTTAFTSSLDWHECLLDVFKAYAVKRDIREDTEYMFHYLALLSNLTYLRLCHKDVVESAEALHRFDLAVQSAVNLTSPDEEWDAFVMEMQGQLFFFAGTLLLKRAQKGSFTWNDVCPLAAVFYLLCQTVPTIDAQATWFVRPSHNREKMYAWMYKNSFFRISQSGHSLYQLCQSDPGTWVQKLQQQCCTPPGQERVYKVLFTLRDMWAHGGQSYLLNTHKFCNASLSMPPRWQLYDVDRVAHTFHPENLSELVWLCLQQYTFGDPCQPDYNFKTFETLQYSVKNMNVGAAETLCQLDTEAFLYATVRCAGLQLKEQQVALEGDLARPPLLPLCLCKKLCTPEQEQWWQTAYGFYSNSVKDSFSKMRQVLQRGLEVVRLVEVNHGLSTTMVVHLAKTFDAKVKSLKEGNHGIRGSTNQLASLESRAAFYWKHALTMLLRLEKNQRGPSPKSRLFDDGDDGDLTPVGVQELLQEAKFASAVIAMKEGRYEEAVKGFEKLTSPWASFYRAQIYKALAQQELEGGSRQESKRQRYTALIIQARDALYLTLDHLGGDKNHELNILLTRELDDVESKLQSFDWVNVAESENGDTDEVEEDTMELQTPVRHQNGHAAGDLPRVHSTPRTDPVSNKSVRQRLIMSELTCDSPITPHRTGGSSAAMHTRPSPERLDAQIKSINYSQSQLFKTVLDRNEELIVMYRNVVDELQESNRQLKTALGENTAIMNQLKGALVDNKEMISNQQKDLAEMKETVKQLKDELQAQAAVAAAAASNPAGLLGPGSLAAQQMAAGYYMGSPYQQQYPPFAQPPPQIVPSATNYRYPLISGFPATRPAQPAAAATAAVRVSERPGGTAPSRVGKFRGSEMVGEEEEEEDEDENGEMLAGLEFGEDFLPTPASPYYMQPEAAHVLQDWIQGQPGAAVAFSPQAQAAIPQPGYFASALRGQALQYGAASTAGVSLAMPGPGFFSVSTPVAIATSGQAQGQSVIATALGGKSPIIPSTPQQIPVVGAGAAKPAQPASPAAKSAETLGVVLLFQGEAKLTTSGGETPSVDIRVTQDTASKQGSIVVTRRDSQDVLALHNIAGIKVIQSFNPNYFLWSVISQSPEKRMDETFRLTFENVEQPRKLRAAVEQVIKSAGIKPLGSPAAAPAFAAQSPPQTVRFSAPVLVTVPSPAIRTIPQSQPSAATPTAATTTTTTPASGPKTVLGGFTFSGTPVVKSGESSKEEKPKASPQFKLKESAVKVTSSPSATAGTATASTNAATTSPSAKPFAGFTFVPPTKPAASMFGSVAATTPTTTTAAASASSTAATSSPGQAFVFGQGSAVGGLSFAGVNAGGQAGVPAFKAGPAPGFSQASQPMFQKAASASPSKSPGGKEEDGVEEYEPNVDFKPVIELPELVEVKTGEEQETKVFMDRVKLFRFSTELSQWKERGVGELKILKPKTGDLQFRVLMRREQVLKVCANHCISPDMKLTPMSASDRAWCYTANDYAEETMQAEKFAVKFKNQDKALQFKTVFEDCQQQLRNARSGAAKAKSPEKTKEQADSGQHKSLLEMFKPAEGSWECSGCLVRNSPSAQRCPACQTLRPGLKPEDVKPAPGEKSLFAAPSPAGGGGSGFGGFKFGAFGGGGGGDKTASAGAGAGGGFKFGAASAPAAAAPTKSLAELFKPAEGSWECPGCLVCNDSSVLKCPACQTLKPGVKLEDVKTAAPSSEESPFAVTGGSSFGGFKLGVDAQSDKATPGGGGFKFGAPLQQKGGDAPAAGGGSGGGGGGFKFTFGEGSGFKFASPATSTATPSSGFVFGSGAASSPAAPSPAATTSAPAPAATTSAPASTAATSAAPTGKFVFGSTAPTTNTQTDSGKGTGFVFGSKAADSATAEAPEEPGSGKGLLEQLLTSEEAPPVKPPQELRKQQPAQEFVFGSPAPAPASQSYAAAAATKPAGFSFSAERPAAPLANEGPKPSGFQARLGQVTSPTTQAGKDVEKKETGFQFTFSLTPQKSTQQKSLHPQSPKSPETDEQGFYLNKEGEDSHIFFEPVVPLPEKVQVKTGEEDEAVLFENRAKLYRFVGSEWKERGVGVLKILQHRETGRVRILMRREQVLKICCNHFITADLHLKPMPRSDGKAWIWYAMDFAEGEDKMEHFAVRFRDAEIAGNFKAAFDAAQEKVKLSKTTAAGTGPSQQAASGPASPPASAAAASRKLFVGDEADDDVVFLYEEKPTQDQLERARKLLLPDTFYLYENRPGCPGCIGCEDYDPSRSPSTQTHKEKTQTNQAVAKPPLPVQEKAEKAPEGLLFGNVASGLSFSALAASTSGGGAFSSAADHSKPFHWSGAGQKLFATSPRGGGDEVDEGEVAPSDDVHFEPVIPLPELVRVQTGEEEWETLFSQRAKLYRFDGTQWKERGIGEMKIIKHREKLMFRVLLRREQVLKVACNHLISCEMTLKPMSTSETAWCWVASDYSEGQPQKEKFAVKFKNVELAKGFKDKFEECQEKLRQGEGKSGSGADSTQTPHSPVQETMSATVHSATGGGGNPCYTRELNVGAQDAMSATVHSATGGGGNPCYTQELNVGAQDAMNATVHSATGGGGNPCYTRELNVGAQDVVSATVQPVTGDRGNPYYSQQLNVGGEDVMTSSTQAVTGDRGNPLYSRQLDVAGQDATITSTTFTPLGGGGNPLFSQLLTQQDDGVDEQYEEYDDDEDDDDDDDEETTEEEEETVFEKRVTLYSLESNQWKKLGLGDLRVLHDDDINGRKLDITKDNGDRMCNHVICMEQSIAVDKKSCEWRPIDFATDEPVRRHFKAVFSSEQAAQEFGEIFRQGQKIALESELSEKVPQEIEVPEIFSAGDGKGASQKP